LLEQNGVLDAGVVMASPTNLELLAANHMLPHAPLDLAVEDLLIVVRGENEAAARAALESVEELLCRRHREREGAFYPKSLRTAIRELPAARWVIVSVPGRFAARVATAALSHDRHVFLFSDNVSVEEEVALKRLAAERGLLCLGPDCGSALIAGAGFGFANRSRRGPIGIVAASGTGLQTLVSRIDAASAGVSHALGIGGRDLSAAVAGRAALQVLELLRRDEETRVIVLLSKPADLAVTSRLLAVARCLEKPVVVYFQGMAVPLRRIGNVRFAASLDEAADLALSSSTEARADEEPTAGATPPGPRRDVARRFLRGLFAGGTLAYEVALGLRLFLQPLFSNLDLDGSERLVELHQSRGHTILDLGADELTAGRPHPMLDPELRQRRLQQEMNDPEVALLLLDIVLGDAVHPDPVAPFRETIASALARGIEAGVILVGTEGDPQQLEDQRQQLRTVGARVFDRTSDAICWAAEALLDRASERVTTVATSALAAPVSAINVGLESFAASLESQGVATIHVDWRPPAGGNAELLAILDRMGA
jgi:FdrA protein